MALSSSGMTGFSRGLVTDALGVDGALLEANDVIITRQGELRKRGGKPNLMTATGGSAFISTHNAASLAGVGTVVNYDSTTSIIPRISVRAPGDAAFSPIGTSSMNGWMRNDLSSFGGSIRGFLIGEYLSLFTHGGEIMSSGSTSGTQAPIRWKGSTKATYATGTISTTSGSTTITGSGTSWMTNLEAGMYLHINSGTLLDRGSFVIIDVTSDTSLVVDQAPDATVAGVAYKASAVGAMSCTAGVFASSIGYPTGRVACSHQGRVFMANIDRGSTFDPQPERIRWSATPAEASGKFIGADYWHANGYTDIGLGQGGGITGLASMGAELVVLKEASIHALRGTVATDGSDLGASVDLISSSHGCLHERGFAVTKLGLVFCDGRGAFVYDGSQVRSLTLGRIQRHWDENMGGETWVSAVGDRIVFTNQTNGGAVVYDLPTDTWTTQTSVQYGQIVATYDADGAPEYEMGFRRYADAVDNWAGDFSTAESQDAGFASSPQMVVRTHPIPLTDPVRTSRPVRVDVNGFATSAVVNVSVHHGREGGSEVAAGTIPAGTTDKPHRFRIPPGSQLTPYLQVEIASSSTLSDARIYGVSILSAPSGRVDP